MGTTNGSHKEPFFKVVVTEGKVAVEGYMTETVPIRRFLAKLAAIAALLGALMKLALLIQERWSTIQEVLRRLLGS